MKLRMASGKIVHRDVAAYEMAPAQLVSSIRVVNKDDSLVREDEPG